MRTRIFQRPGIAVTRSLSKRIRRRKKKGGLRRTKQPQEKRTPMWNTSSGRYDPAMGRKRRSSPGALRYRVLGRAHQQGNQTPNGQTTGTQGQTDSDSELLRGRSSREWRKGNCGTGPKTLSALHAGNFRSSTTGARCGRFSTLLVDLPAPSARSMGIHRHEVQQPPVPARLHEVGSKRVFTDTG